MLGKSLTGFRTRLACLGGLATLAAWLVMGAWVHAWEMRHGMSLVMFLCSSCSCLDGYFGSDRTGSFPLCLQKRQSASPHTTSPYTLSNRLFECVLTIADNKPFFSGWCVVSFIWVWASMTICVIYPVVESRNAVVFVCRGLARDFLSAVGMRAKETGGDRPQRV